MTEASSSRACAVRQPVEPQLRQPGQLVGLDRLTDREHERDRLRLQAPRYEGEDLPGGAIEPLRVVDQAQQRPVFGRLGQQAEHGEADQEAVGLGA